MVYHKQNWKLNTDRVPRFKTAFLKKKSIFLQIIFETIGSSFLREYIFFSWRGINSIGATLRRAVVDGPVVVATTTGNNFLISISVFRMISIILKLKFSCLTNKHDKLAASNKHSYVTLTFDKSNNFEQLVWTIT